MIIAIIIICLSLIWLGRESNWLRVRLLRPSITLKDILPVVFGIIQIFIGISIIPCIDKWYKVVSERGTSVGRK